MVKIKNWPPLERQKGSGWKVYTVSSVSNPGRFHIVAIGYDIIVSESEEGFDIEEVNFLCSCDGFQYSGNCWHVNKVREETT